MRLFIKNEADRLAVAAILIKNGYTVRQTFRESTGRCRRASSTTKGTRR